MVDYVESPVDRIISIHRKKKEEPPPPDGEPNVPKCNTYGYGAIMGEAAGLITSLPYGPYLMPPFTDPLPPPYQAFSAADHGLAAQDIWLIPPGVIVFKTNQLVLLAIEHPELGGDPNFAYGAIFGYQPIGFQISMQWNSPHSRSDAQIGLGLTHPGANVPIGGSVPAPPAPFLVLGSPVTGRGTYSYRFAPSIPGPPPVVNNSNQFDPAIGGTAVLWWMVNAGGGWVADRQLMVRELIDEGDWYAWQISAICGPLLPGIPPPLPGGIRPR